MEWFLSDSDLRHERVKTENILLISFKHQLRQTFVEHMASGKQVK